MEEKIEENSRKPLKNSNQALDLDLEKLFSEITVPQSPISHKSSHTQ